MTTIQEKIDETEVLADSPFSVARDVSIAKLEIGFEGSFSEKSKRDSADYKVTSLSWLIFEREQPMQPQDYAVWSGVVFLSVLLVSFVLGFDSSIHQATGIGAGLFFGSLGTLITCSIPIALFIFVPRYRRHINSMLVSKSIADILLAISFLLTPVWEKFHDGDENSCKYVRHCAYIPYITILTIHSVALVLPTVFYHAFPALVSLHRIRSTSPD